LIHRQFDDALDVAGQRDLRAWIMADDENARIFARESIIHHRIHENLASRDAQSVREVAEASGDASDVYLVDLQKLKELDGSEAQLVQLSEAEAEAAANRGKSPATNNRELPERL